MLKLEIKLLSNTKKADSEDMINDIYSNLDMLFEKNKFRMVLSNDGTHCYYGNGNPEDYGVFGRLITTLRKKEWFINNVCKWMWYNSDDGEDEDDYSVEDVLYHYTKRKSIA